MPLIGLTPATPPTVNASQQGAWIFDVTTKDFETKVLKASMTTPILIDFWATWCGPCKQLTPLLEAEVNATNGAVLLAKVDIEASPELAQAFRVQSVPMVMAIFQGQPVTGFVGVQPVSEIKKIIAQLIKLEKSAQPQAQDNVALLEQAGAALASGDAATAMELYGLILADDPMHVTAYVGLVRAVIATGDLVQAEDLIVNVSDDMKNASGFAAAQAALDLARATPDQGDMARLRGMIDKNPDDHQARLDLATCLFAAGDKDAAMDELIDSIKRDRAWDDNAARKKLIQFFDALGPTDPMVKNGRRKLSAVLFS